MQTLCVRIGAPRPTIKVPDDVQYHRMIREKGGELIMGSMEANIGYGSVAEEGERGRKGEWSGGQRSSEECDTDCTAESPVS